MGRSYRKIIGVILCIAMFLGILPNTSMQAEQVFADDTAVSDDTVFVGDVDGDERDILSEYADDKVEVIRSM